MSAARDKEGGGKEVMGEWRMTADPTLEIRYIISDEDKAACKWYGEFAMEIL